MDKPENVECVLECSPDTSHLTTKSLDSFRYIENSSSHNLNALIPHLSTLVSVEREKQALGSTNRPSGSEIDSSTSFGEQSTFFSKSGYFSDLDIGLKDGGAASNQLSGSIFASCKTGENVSESENYNLNWPNESRDTNTMFSPTDKVNSSTNSITSLNTLFNYKNDLPCCRDSTQTLQSPFFVQENAKADGLVSILEFPPEQQSIFNFLKFNKMQSECFEYLYKLQNNCVISAPTGSGKTVLFELAILRALNDDPKSKSVYLAPTKALCNERYKDWKSKFSMLNLNVALFTGDEVNYASNIISKLEVIISTPEKWDSVTRQGITSINVLSQFKLLLIDEIHFVGDTRGAVLELVLSRMRLSSQNLRIIALSATIANINDISSWIKSNSGSSEPAITLKFDDSYRSVSLQKSVIGLPSKGSNNFKFDYSLNSKVIELLEDESRGKATLIFCPTRNSCINTAKHLSMHMKKRAPKIMKHCVNLTDKDLANFAKNEVAYHHAGLSYSDRHKIENGFLNGEINALCCTSTLAVGVNLPAYLVIVKGTKCWSNNGFVEYSETDILQMIGRAGRPDFEDFGKAIIMTEVGNIHKYEKLVSGTDNTESTLHTDLGEHLINEVNLGSIQTVADALTWIKTTFLYQRCLKNWKFYLPNFPIVRSSSDVESSLTQHLEVLLEKLRAENILQYVENVGYTCTIYGKMMSKFYIKLKTMKLIMSAPYTQTVLDILDMLSKSDEFSSLKVKFNEKKLLRAINKSPLIKFPASIKEFDVQEKVHLFIQFELGGIEFPIFEGSQKLMPNFHSDKSNIMKTSIRILRCLIEIFTYKRDSVSLTSTFRLFCCLSGKCWDQTPMVLKQLEGIGVTYMKKLVNNGISDLDSLKKLSIQQLEYYLGVKAGISSKLYKGIRAIPELKLGLRFNGESISEKNSTIRFRFNVDVSVLNAAASKLWRNKSLIICIISHLSNGTLLDFRRIPVSKFVEDSNKSFVVSFVVSDLNAAILVNAFSESIAGIEPTAKMELKGLVNAETLSKRLPLMVEDNNFEVGFESFSSSSSGAEKEFKLPLSTELGRCHDESRRTGKVITTEKPLIIDTNSEKRKIHNLEMVASKADSFLSEHQASTTENATPAKKKVKTIKLRKVEIPSYFDNSSDSEFYLPMLKRPQVQNENIKE